MVSGVLTKSIFSIISNTVNISITIWSFYCSESEHSKQTVRGMYVAIILGLRFVRGEIKAVGERLDHKMGEIYPPKPFEGTIDIQHQWVS
jgi:hypothetical protein